MRQLDGAVAQTSAFAAGCAARCPRQSREVNAGRFRAAGHVIDDDPAGPAVLADCMRGRAGHGPVDPVKGLDATTGRAQGAALDRNPCK